MTEITTTISQCSRSAVKTERGVIVSDARILKDLGDACKSQSQAREIRQTMALDMT